MDRRRFLQVASTAPFLTAVPRLFAQEPPAEQGGFEEVTHEQHQAIQRGFEYLCGQQGRSGAIGPTCQVAFTSLGCLAFLASGSTPHRGPYAANIRKGTHFLLRNAGRNGYINEGNGRSAGGSGMHGHGYATLFFAELLGMQRQPEEPGERDIQKVLARAVDIIESSQDPTGGWTYDPNPNGHEGSVTITQVQALRAARNVGIVVNPETVRKGIDYIKKTTNPDGTVAYGLGMRGGQGTYALTAAGMCVFNYFGLFDAPEVVRGMKALKDYLSGKRGRASHHDYYAHFYAAQALNFARRYDRAAWEAGYGVIRSELLRNQNKVTGGWERDGGNYGGAFGTACALCVLQVPYRMLSIFES